MMNCATRNLNCSTQSLNCATRSLQLQKKLNQHTDPPEEATL